MRKRKEIEDAINEDGIYMVIVETLLDIRELLANDSEYIKRLNLAKVKVISPEETEKEIERELFKKYESIIRRQEKKEKRRRKNEKEQSNRTRIK